MPNQTPAWVVDELLAAVVQDATEELRDAPVQTFVPLIAENNARNRLRERADEVDHGSAEGDPPDAPRD